MPLRVNRHNDQSMRHRVIACNALGIADINKAESGPDKSAEVGHDKILFVHDVACLSAIFNIAEKSPPATAVHRLPIYPCQWSQAADIFNYSPGHGHSCRVSISILRHPEPLAMLCGKSVELAAFGSVIAVCVNLIKFVQCLGIVGLNRGKCIVDAVIIWSRDSHGQAANAHRFRQHRNNAVLLGIADMATLLRSAELPPH